MVKCYYIVIVGTQPGVYSDWSQVGPKVSGISGSIHKKFKTRAEAWRAFNRATREGTVRAVRVDPESDTASSSDPSFPPRAARDNRRPYRQQQRAQGQHGHEIERPAPALRPAARVQSYSRRRAADPTHTNVVSSAQASPSGIAERMDPITMGSEPQDRDQSSDLESRNAPEYVSNTEDSASPSSRPVSLPTRGRSNERWQGNQYGPVDALQSSSRADHKHAAIAHRETRQVRTSTETRRRSRESLDAAVLQSAGSSYSIHMVSFLPQIEDDLGISGNAACTHGTPPRSSPLTAQNCRTDIEPKAYTPGSPIASSQAYGEGDEKGKSRASVQRFDAYLDSFDWSEIQEKACIQQTTIITDDHPNVPVLSRPPSACSHISLVSSAESFRSVMSFDIHAEAVETSESPAHSAHVLGPTPQRAVAPLSISGSAEDAIPDPPTRSQQCLDDDEDGTYALATTQPPRTPSDDSGSFGILVDSTSPSRRAHFPQVDRQCLGQCAPEVCPALSRSPSPEEVRSTSISTTHPLTQSSHLSLIDISAASPHRAWPLLSSLPPQPHIDPEVSVSPEVIGLGLSIEDPTLPSSQRHALPHRTASQSSPRIRANLPAGSTAEQSPTRDDRSQLDAPESQGRTPLSCPWAVADDRAPSGGTRSMNGAAPSPRNVPLPSSPSPPGSATSSTPTHLQAQPSHRLSPNHPFYPSLAGDDDNTVTSDRQSILPTSTTTTRAPPQQHRPSPSGLHNFAFGFPALGLSPVIQVPTLIRSPLTDVHSPIRLDADTGCRRRRSYHGFITVACYFFFCAAPFIHFACLGNSPRSWVHVF